LLCAAGIWLIGRSKELFLSFMVNKQLMLHIIRIAAGLHLPQGKGIPDA
jgi:hypothetical protein